MRKNISCLILVTLLALPALTACSKEEKPKSAGEAIKEMTDKVATDAEEKIRKPLDKAREMANKGEERLEQIQKEMEKGQ